LADTQGSVLPTITETVGYKAASLEWVLRSHESTTARRTVLIIARAVASQRD
jgi:hypothetical protein